MLELIGSYVLRFNLKGQMLPLVTIPADRPASSIFIAWFVLFIVNLVLIVLSFQFGHPAPVEEVLNPEFLNTFFDCKLLKMGNPDIVGPGVHMIHGFRVTIAFMAQ